MITQQQLTNNGFICIGTHNNRTYYYKKYFYIVEHQGQIYKADSELNSEYENPYEDINDLMNDYNSWLYEVIEKLKKLLNYLTSEDEDENEL
jgi:hypothetical protein